MIPGIVASSVPPAGGGVEYEGPLDIVGSAVVAYGQRALSAAMLGQPLYTIREDAGDTEQTFNADAVTGDAPVAAITTFLDGANGSVSSWKDQSGNADHAVQATPGDQPVWVSNQQGGRPAFTGGSLLSSAASFPDGALTVFAVVKGAAETTTEGSGYIDVMYGAAAYNDMFDGANEAGGNYPGLVTDADYHLIDMAWQNGENSYFVDGVEAAENNDFDSGVVGPLTLEVALLFFSSSRAEEIIYSGILTDPQRLAIRQNIAAYYGITL